MTTDLSKYPPGPGSWIPGRSFLGLRRDPLGYLTWLTRTYGDLSSFGALGQRYVVLNHPELAKEVLLTQADAFWKGPALQRSKGILGEGLLTAEGDAHKNQRRMMQPAFHAKRVETYATDVVACTRDLCENWARTAAGESHILDMRRAMMGLTLVIAGRTLFGTMLEEEVERVRESMEALMGGYVRTVVPWGGLLNRLPVPETLRLRRAQAGLEELVERMIAARRREMTSGGELQRDLLSALLASNEDGVQLTDKQLRDQAITILTASHETTANAMTFTLWLLAKHPEEQSRLRSEISAALHGRNPAVADFEKLERTRWVLSESMRLYPPAWTLGRQSQRAVDIGGYRLPAKCTVLIPQWTMHRDARFFPEPLAFQPERWRSPTHPRHAYLPFSTGPRNCIGESFAWVEMILALAMLVQRFRFEPAEGSEELSVIPAITLRPRGAVRIHVRT